MVSRRVVIEFLGQDKSLSKTSEKVGRDTDSLGKKLAGFGKVAAAGLGAAALGAGIAGKELFTLGGRLEQMGQKAATVFGPQIGQVDKWAKANAAAMGLTKREATGLAANFGDLLIPMGFTREQAAKMSTDVVGLSGALSQWSGGTKSAAEVSEILSAAMLGETDGLKALGISISAAEVDAALLAKGQDKLTGSAKQQAEATAVQALIMAKSMDAQAAFAKGGSPLLSAQAKIKAAFMETRDELAVRLVPVFAKLTGFVVSHVIPALGQAGTWARSHLLPPLRQVAGWLQENLIPALQHLAGFIQTVVIPYIRTLATGALEGLRSAFGKISKAIEENRPQLEKLIQGIGAVIKVLYEKLGPILAWIVKNGFKVLGVAITGLIYAIGWLVDNVPPFVKKIAEIGTAVAQTVGAVIKFFGDLPGNITKAIGDTTKTLVQKGKDFIEGLKNGIWAVAKGIDSWMVRAPVAKVIAPWYGAVKWLVGAGKNIISGLMSGVWSVAKTLGTWVNTNVIQPPLRLFVNAGTWLYTRGSALVGGLRSGVWSVAKGLGSWVWYNVARPPIDQFAKAGSWLLSAGANIIHGLKSGIWNQMKGIGSWIKSTIVDPMVKAVKNFFGIKSPSKVFEGIGGHLIGGLMKGMGSGMGGAVAKKVFGDMPSALSSLVGKGLISLKGLPKKALDALSNIQGAIIPGDIGVLSGPNRRVFYQGEALDLSTYRKIKQAERLIGGALNVTQGSYERPSSFSGSTHTGGGVFDVVGGNLDRINAVLRQLGFASWVRYPWQGPWPRHIHAIERGNPSVAPSAARQVLDFMNGGDGLGGYKLGTPWVPNDQLAFLHKGEAVIPAEVNRRRGEGAMLTVNLVLDGKVVQQSLVRLKKLNGGLELGLA